MSKAEEIKSIIQNQGYDVGIISQLETYLIAQAEGKEAYDFDANRTLVKLYQFSPASGNSEMRAVALVLSIVFGESIEYGALNCLIPENAKGEEVFATISQCADLLDTCQFKNMWESFLAIPLSLSKSKHAQDALRKSILGSLSLTLKNITMSSLQAMLDLKTEGELKEFLASKGTLMVESVNNGIVTFLDNSENTKRVKTHQEGLGADYGVLHTLINAASE